MDYPVVWCYELIAIRVIITQRGFPSFFKIIVILILYRIVPSVEITEFWFKIFESVQIQKHLKFATEMFFDVFLLTIQRNVRSQGLLSFWAVPWWVSYHKTWARLCHGLVYRKYSYNSYLNMLLKLQVKKCPTECSFLRLNDYKINNNCDIMVNLRWKFMFFKLESHLK